MTNLLTELLNAGLIENLNGDDGRFLKIEQAANSVAQELREQPEQLIRAILAGLDPDIPKDDPIIVQAEQALVAEWKALRSVFPDTPVNLLRAILLEACNQVAPEENNAAILWLTAADTLPLLRLGREEAIVLKMVEEWARCAEQKALAGLALTDDAEEITVGELKLPKATKLESPKVDRQELLKKTTTAVGQPNSNHYGVVAINHPGFADRMHQLLADELDALATKLSKSQTEAGQQVQAYLTKLTEVVNESLVVQQRRAQEARQAEQIRLNALWWSEALYSSPLRCSYRELPPGLAAVVMAGDLLNEVAIPTTASVGYLLAEAVNRLPDADFTQKLTLQALLEALGNARDRLDNEWRETFTVPPETGRLSLRDGIILALTDKAHRIETTLKRMGASGTFALSLPDYAHALFRQEQAVQLAGEQDE